MDEAIINQFQEIVQKAQFKPGMIGLDAGCGVGGGAIYIAKNTGTKVVGITIAPSQVIESRKNAVLAGVETLTEFREMDYSHTDFPDNYFDVIFAIESVCHSSSKGEFLKESRRILKPGGKLIISDGYLRRMPNNDTERQIVSTLCRVWRLGEMIEVGQMTKSITAAGFDLISCQDMASRVRPTFKRMQYLIMLARPLVWLSGLIQTDFLRMVRDNSDSMEFYARGDKLGLVGHFTHVAIK